jgi:short-subunit dehydrogenase
LTDNNLHTKDIAMLICNAGAAEPGPVLTSNPQTAWERTISVNLLHPIYFNKAILGHMKQRRERSAIINVSSIMGVVPCPGQLNYSTEKAALSFFSQGLSFELKKESSNIDVQDYVPGGVATGFSSMKEGLAVISPR